MAGGAPKPDRLRRVPRILVTNDDGVRSAGIAALAESLAPLGDVYVVAPAAESSAIGHALTLRRPLRLTRIAEHWFSVDGTPTDCVNIAASRILRGIPELVVSGINIGWNLGDDVTYSGTVAGALEGALLGAPSLAGVAEAGCGESRISRRPPRPRRNWQRSSWRRGLPPRTFLNVNVPRGPARGIKSTWQARRNHKTAVTEAFDPRHQPYYWIDVAQLDWESDRRSDYQAVRDGWISVTPLQPDWTAHEALGTVDALLSGANAEAG